jgi:hypothetical protein
VRPRVQSQYWGKKQKAMQQNHLLLKLLCFESKPASDRRKISSETQISKTGQECYPVRIFVLRAVSHHCPRKNFQTLGVTFLLKILLIWIFIC